MTGVTESNPAPYLAYDLETGTVAVFVRVKGLRPPYARFLRAARKEDLETLPAIGPAGELPLECRP